MKMVYQSDGKIIKEDIIEEWDSVTLGSKYLYDLRDRTIEELSDLRKRVQELEEAVDEMIFAIDGCKDQRLRDWKEGYIVKKYSLNTGSEKN